MNACRNMMVALALLVLGLVSGCGGSGGSGPAAAKMVTGVAATGAPVVGTVILKDSSAPSKTLTVSTASDGSFAFNTDGLTPPFIIKVSASGSNLYSLATDNGIANLTPLTTMAVSQAAGGANLDQLFDSNAKAEVAAAAAKMPAAVEAVQQTLAPLMTKFGVTGNILSGQFDANHTGVDAMMDAITVIVASGRVVIVNKQNGAVLMNASGANLTGAALTGTLPTPSAAVPTSAGSSLYTSKCAGCHGVLANSNLKGRATLGSVQAAIASNRGGMSLLSGMSAADIQAILDAIAAPAAPAAGTPPATPAPAPTPATGLSGAALYDANCAGCHGALDASTKTGATVVRIQNAISGGVGGMGSISLNAADIQAIAAALSPVGSTPAPVPSPSPSPAPADGAALYAANCAGCHSALASSTKKGITLSRLQTAVTNNIGGMGFLSTLSPTQQQAVVDALVLTPAPAPAPTPTPTPTPTPAPNPAPDGAALYAANCAGCHGTLASSTKQGITIARLQNAISNNVAGMGSLSRLTVTEVQAIVTALNPATPTPTPTPTPAPAPNGAALYGSNCQGCHGALASSGKAGASLTRLQNAISGNVGGMGYLSSLSTQEQQAIVTALAAVTPPPAPTPAPSGATLYTTNCAGCHGALASSGKAGATSSRIQTAISANTGNMGYLSTLSSADISAIAAALATVAPAPTPAPVCGSCHAIPPANGQHSRHKSKGIACATCHGSGYSTTTFNAATHNNGIKNLTTTIGWNATSRSCSNSCHGRETW